MTTYTCEACRTQITADTQPLECRQCKSRLLKAAVATATKPAPAVQDGPLADTGARSRKKNGLLLFTIMHWTYWGLIAIGGLVAWAVVPADQRGEWLPLPNAQWANAAIAMYLLLVLIFVACTAMMVIAVVLGLIRIHRAWQCVQPLRQLDPAEAGMPTPAKAVGFLFIPGFNIYWVFVALVGLARRMNRYTAERMIPASRVSVAVAMSLAILWLVGGILNVVAAFTHPLVGWITAPAYAILSYVFIYRITRVANAIRAVE